MHFIRKFALCLIACAMASGCGGSDEHLREDGGQVSYYSILGFRNSQLLAVIAFEGGLVYGFYQSDFSTTPVPAFAYEGFFVARPIAGEQSTELQGVDVNFEGREETPIKLSTGGTDESSFRAVLTDGAIGTPETIAGSSASSSTLPTDQSTLAGVYAVQARSAIGSSTGTANVSTSGVINADLSATCNVEAKLSSRPIGNMYDVTAQISGTCSTGSGAYTGHGLQAQATKNVYVLLTRPSGGGVMLFLSPS